MTITKKQDFIELKFTGYQDSVAFDSNIPEDLKKINPEAKPEKTIICIGEGMVLQGLDKALEGKELNKDYEIHVPYKDGFGERKRDLIKTIPLSVFREKNINPKPGMPLLMDNSVARIITVSGARVMTDFNNPLAGKDLDYKFKIVRIVEDEDEKLKAFFKYFLRIIPEFESSEKFVTIKGPKEFEQIPKIFNERFSKIFKKDLAFKFQESKEDNKNHNNP